MANLKMTHLHVNFMEYGPHVGKYTGSVGFRGQYGTVDIVLSPSLSEKVLTLCADALVENAKEVASDLTAQIIEQTLNAAIEDKS